MAFSLAEQTHGARRVELYFDDRKNNIEKEGVGAPDQVNWCSRRPAENRDALNAVP